MSARVAFESGDDLDVCACGDWRKDHAGPEGRGPCWVCNDTRQPVNGECDKFRAVEIVATPGLFPSTFPRWETKLRELGYAAWHRPFVIKHKHRAYVAGCHKCEIQRHQGSPNLPADLRPGDITLAVLNGETKWLRVISESEANGT